MNARLNKRQVEDVVVLDMSGRLTLGEGASLLRDEVRELVKAGEKKVLIDLGGVSYVDSAGIGELVAGVTTLSHSGGSLKLLNVSKRIFEMLKTIKLHTVFEMFEDELVAVRSFA